MGPVDLPVEGKVAGSGAARIPDIEALRLLKGFQLVPVQKEILLVMLPVHEDLEPLFDRTGEQHRVIEERIDEGMVTI